MSMDMRSGHIARLRFNDETPYECAFQLGEYEAGNKFVQDAQVHLWYGFVAFDRHSVATAEEFKRRILSQEPVNVTLWDGRYGRAIMVGEPWYIGDLFVFTLNGITPLRAK